MTTRVGFPIRQLLLFIALPLAYVVTGRLGLLLAIPPGYATAVFVPAGIAVAAMFIAGRVTLVGTFIGSFLLNLWIGVLLEHRFEVIAVAAALVIALASSLQAGIGGAVLRRLIGYPAPLDSPRSVILFLLLPFVFCLTSATLSLSGLWAMGLVTPANLAANWTTWWAGDALGVLVALPLVLVLLGEPRSLWRSRASFVAIPMIVCFAVFVAIFVRARAWEAEQSLLQFRIQSQHVVDRLKANLEEQSIFLEQLSNIFAIRNRAVTRQDFHALVQGLLQRFPTIQAVEWAPKVLPAERGEFVYSQRAEIPGFWIRERDESARLRPAGERNQFYPVTYVEPLSGNEEVVGFDLGSESNRLAAIDGTFSNGHVTASAPIRLVQEHAKQLGMLLALGVPNGPTGSGVVLIVLRMGTFAASAAEPFRSVFGLKLLDTAESKPFFDSLAASDEPSYQNSFGFGGRQYLVQTAPSAEYLAHHRGWEGWAVLAAGALGTGLLGALLLLATGHTYRLKSLADRLQISEERASTDLLAMTRLHRLSNRLLRESGEANQSLQEVVETAIAISGADKGNIQLLDSDTGALTIVAQRGFEAPFLKFFAHVRDDASACAAAMQSKDCVIVEDVIRSDIFARQPTQKVLLDAGVQAVISTPLTSSAGNLLGMVSVHFSRPHRPSERELRLLDLLARQTADHLERKNAKEIADTLARELQHRSNNLLAVIQTIAHRSLSGDYSLAQARSSFEARLQALARANRQLSKSNSSAVNLNEVVRIALQPFSERTIIEGIDVSLGPKYAQNFMLALHELATNAAKYGALSNGSGKVEIFWTIASQGNSPILTFKWREKGGPPVTSPSRRGFGTDLLKAAFPDARIAYATEGFSCEIDVILGNTVAGQTES